MSRYRACILSGVVVGVAIGQADIVQAQSVPAVEMESIVVTALDPRNIRVGVTG